MSTGPITLFDKSFVQALSLDESVWFDHFYYTVICPIFYVETLADLSKTMRAGRTSEKEVAKIADKVPEVSGNPCPPHVELCTANLCGHSVPMDGRIMMRGGVPVESGERRGYVFHTPPEADAFNRWQQGRFNEVEAQYASQWRETVSTLDLDQAARILTKFGIDSDGCKSLQDAYTLASEVIRAQRAYDQMALAVTFLGVPRYRHQQIVERWQLNRLCPLAQFAPYAAFVMKIELFFQIAVRAGLIAATRPSNRVDIAYLFYLPFCRVFVSSDKLHRRCAPLFMREDQEFVWGPDLKEDLAALNKRYSDLSEEIKNLGVMRFASTPPQEGGFLTSALWDRHLNPNWRNRDELDTTSPTTNKHLVNELKRFKDGERIQPEEVDFDIETADAMTVERRVRKRKGTWFQLPKDYEEADG